MKDLRWFIPADTCIEAGTTLTALIQGNDPDNDFVLLEKLLEVFYQDVSFGILPLTVSPPGVFSTHISAATRVVGI